MRDRVRYGDGGGKGGGCERENTITIASQKVPMGGACYIRLKQGGGPTFEIATGCTTKCTNLSSIQIVWDSVAKYLVPG